MSASAGTHETLVTETGRAPAQAPISRGTVIGRYVVLDRLGAGGMGVVYAAYDPDLDRKLALKFLHPSSREGSEGGTRLLREALALAKLSHPNIVAVHDVGTIDDRVWIAMEHVHGTTLTQWLRAGVRPWQDVLAALVAAGRGLAAAHAAGLVHRDFKPDNVMIGDVPEGDRGIGRVRVMDFGLARTQTTPTDSTSDDPSSSRSSAVLATDVTRVGSIVGTPAYMAPEQHARSVGDARSDQFAFCVTLWEALYGQRPFHGTSLAELVANTTSGHVRTPARTRRVPGWLRRAALRGLAPDPDARWTAMDALLQVLERGRARARLRRLAIAGAIVVAATSAVAGARALDRRTRTKACEREADVLDAAWNATVRDRVRDSILATGLDYAPSTAERVIPRLDAHADAWRSARTDACLHVDVHGTWDAATRERAEWCLETRRLEIASLVGRLEHADAERVQHAIAAVSGLSALAPCRDVDILARLPTPPPDRRTEIQAVREESARVSAVRGAGEHVEGIELARASLAHAETIGWPPLVATMQSALGDLLEDEGHYDEAERALEDAFFTATAAGDADTAADAASLLVTVVGVDLARHREGLRWARQAEVVFGQIGEDGSALARHLSRVGDLRFEMGELSAAKAQYEQSLEIEERIGGRDHPMYAQALGKLANVHKVQGEFPQARALYERVMAIQQETFGTEHPLLATTYTNLSHADYATGDYEQSANLLQHALDIRTRELGPEHPELAPILLNLGSVYFDRGDLAKARGLYERALTIQQSTLGPEHPDVGTSLGNLALLLSTSGAHAEAKAMFERAIAVQEKALGREHPGVAGNLANLAATLEALGEAAAARSAYERAVTIMETALGPEHPDLAWMLVGLARLDVDTDPERALARAQRALAIQERTDAAPLERGKSRFTLSRAQWNTGRDRARAVASARTARDELRSAGSAADALAAEIDRWLKTHRADQSATQ